MHVQQLSGSRKTALNQEVHQGLVSPFATSGGSDARVHMSKLARTLVVGKSIKPPFARGRSVNIKCQFKRK